MQGEHVIGINQLYKLTAQVPPERIFRPYENPATGLNRPRIISLWRNVLLFWVGRLCCIPNTPSEINMPESVDGRMLMLISLMASKCTTMGSPSYQAAEFSRTVFKRSTEEALIRSNSMTF